MIMEFRRGRRVDDPVLRAMRRGYTNQRSMAKRRGIAFHFTFEQWKAWWLTDRRWTLRGRNKNSLVMARLEDKGDYSPENVYCATQRSNSASVSPKVRRAITVRAWFNHPERMFLMGSGAKHPCSRPVKTPLGIFGSATLAAEAFNITRQYAASRARARRDGWEYVDSY